MGADALPANMPQLIQRAIDGVLLGISDDSIEAAEAVQGWLATLRVRVPTGKAGG
jgi:hypothetical protein